MRITSLPKPLIHFRFNQWANSLVTTRKKAPVMWKVKLILANNSDETIYITTGCRLINGNRYSIKVSPSFSFKGGNLWLNICINQSKGCTLIGKIYSLKSRPYGANFFVIGRQKFLTGWPPGVGSIQMWGTYGLRLLVTFPKSVERAQQYLYSFDTFRELKWVQLTFLTT